MKEVGTDGVAASLYKPLTAIERIALESLRQIATEGREATQAELCAATGVKYQQGTLPAILKRLEDKGYIKREIFHKGMQVHIVPLGISTARPSCTVPHWRDIDRDSTPTLPRHTITRTLNNLMAYINQVMREENMTCEAVQLMLMSRGMAHREAELFAASANVSCSRES